MVKKINADNLKRKTITFEELATMATIPEIPKHFREQLFGTVKIPREVRITEETEHFLNIMGLHFGLSRNDVIDNAIKLMWRDVVGSMTAEQLASYEERLEVLRLYRLQQTEERNLKKAERARLGIQQWEKENPDKPKKGAVHYETWSYSHDKAVAD